jgi:hypothetical protein
MACLAQRVVKLLPPAWQSSIEKESRDWVMRCPCGHETSVWEQGGVRFKAAGNPLRSGRCGKCGNVFVGQIFRRSRETQPAGADSDPGYDSSTSLPLAPRVAPRKLKPEEEQASFHADTAIGHALADTCLLWIDGVGCYRIVGRNQMSIGSHTSSDDGADLRLLAPLSRRHAVITRSGEAYWLQTEPSENTEGRLLRGGETFEIGGGVRLRLRVPNSLSNTAVIEFVSPHRPVQRIDGAVLLEQVCILGPADDSHIRCPGWPAPIVLFRRGDELWCKGAGLALNGVTVNGEVALTSGDVLTADELRLRVELSCD